MATSTIPANLGGYSLGSSTSAFSSLISGYPGQALDYINTNISNLSTGVVQAVSSGRRYFAVLGKLNDSIYSGILFSYVQEMYHFRKADGRYYVYRMF